MLMLMLRFIHDAEQSRAEQNRLDAPDRQTDRSIDPAPTPGPGRANDNDNGNDNDNEPEPNTQSIHIAYVLLARYPGCHAVTVTVVVVAVVGGEERRNTRQAGR